MALFQVHILLNHWAFAHTPYQINWHTQLLLWKCRDKKTNAQAFAHSDNKFQWSILHAPTHKGMNTPTQQHYTCVTPPGELHVALVSPPTGPIACCNPTGQQTTAAIYYESLTTLKLSHALDSFVCVSRRVKRCPFTINDGYQTSIGSTTKEEAYASQRNNHTKRTESKTEAFTRSDSKFPCTRLHVPTHKGTNTPRQQHYTCVDPPEKLLVAIPQNSEQWLQSTMGTQTSFASISAVSITFNTIFKVIFMFPILALGCNRLLTKSRLGRKLPPTSCSNSKERDS